IWVLLAMIFRAIFSEPKPQAVVVNDSPPARAQHDARCAECGAVLQADDSFCAVCGRAKSSAGPISGPIADLVMTARQLDKFLNQGKLDAETHKLVMRVVEEERARLIAPVRLNVSEAPRETEMRPVVPAPIAVNQLRDDGKSVSPQA